MEAAQRDSLASTGVPGLDVVLGGGFPRGHLYLVDGPPGSGKTTMALQFLLEGIRAGERSVYVTLSESEAELRSIARSHGWTVDDLVICDLQSAEEALQSEAQYTLFHPAEIELSETTEMVLRAVEQNRPERIVFDSLSEMRLLARDSLRYRRQILAMKHYFANQGSTVLLLDTDSESEFQLASVAHGVVRLEQLVPTYGAQRRRMRVQKIRGASYREGYHDLTIETGGLCVFPRLVASDHAANGKARDRVSSGVPELDELVGGGLVRGSSTLILGPSGAGKSTLATQYAVAAIARGERVAAFLFDEGVTSWAHRGDSLGMDVGRHLESGALRVRQVNPAELTPGAFAHRVRSAIEDDGCRLVLIDSLNGYRESMPEERFLALHLHELLAYLNEKGVVSLMTMVQHGIVGEDLQSPLELSYVADAVVMLRFFEAFGEIRQAVSMIKNRYGDHEHKIREFRLQPGHGVMLGQQLREFTGVLGGNLRYHGAEPDLFERAAE